MTQRIAVLISGRGSNLQALAQACAAERWPARLAGVVCNRPQASGLRLAAELGLPCQVVDHTQQASRDAFDQALAQAVDALAPDLVLLAGFMRVLGGAFVQRFNGRLLNIHPSLLPAFAGLDTHRRALEAGCKLAGATVHLVTPTLDHGPIIAQAAVPVRADDTPQQLACRVLAAEHRLYPLAVGWWLRGELALQGPPGAQLVHHRLGAPQWLLLDDMPQPAALAPSGATP